MSQFVIYHNWSEGSGKPTIVYVGDNKADAFEALWKFLMDDVSQGCTGLSRVSAPTPYMTTISKDGDGK